MPHCMLCGKPYLFRGKMKPLSDRDRKGNEIMACVSCFDKVQIGTCVVQEKEEKESDWRGSG